MATHKTAQVTSLTVVLKSFCQGTVKNPVKYLYKDWYLFLTSTKTLLTNTLDIFYIHLILGQNPGQRILEKGKKMIHAMDYTNVNILALDVILQSFKMSPLGEVGWRDTWDLSVLYFFATYYESKIIIFNYFTMKVKEDTCTW